MMILLAWVATLLSAGFALILAGRFVRGRQPASLVWALAMLFFAVGSAAETSARMSAWTVTSAKVYYLFGAGLTAGWLGAGTLLLGGRRAGRAAIAVALAASAVIAWQVIAAPVDQAHLSLDGFRAIQRPATLRLPVILMNVGGTLAILLPTAGAAVRAARADAPWSRPVSLLLIAAGVLIIAAGHSLAGLVRVAPAAALSLVNAVGAVLMFSGQLRAGRPRQPGYQPRA